jgi:hypothetical protein
MEITLTDFIEHLQALQQEIGCDGKKIGSHNIRSFVHFHITNPDIGLDLTLDNSYYTAGLQLNLLPGCLCPDGVIINLNATVS